MYGSVVKYTIDEAHRGEYDYDLSMCELDLFIRGLFFLKDYQLHFLCKVIFTHSDFLGNILTWQIRCYADVYEI